MTLPAEGSAQAASTSHDPTQSLQKVTGLPRFSCRIFATGAMENFSTTLPLGRPRWDANTMDLAPFSKTFLMVGKAPSIRWVSVILVGSAFVHAKGDHRRRCKTSSTATFCMAVVVFGVSGRAVISSVKTWAKMANSQSVSALAVLVPKCRDNKILQA